MRRSERPRLVNAASINLPTEPRRNFGHGPRRFFFFSLSCAWKSEDLGTNRGSWKKKGAVWPHRPASVSPNYCCCKVVCVTLRCFARKRFAVLEQPRKLFVFSFFIPGAVGFIQLIYEFRSDYKGHIAGKNENLVHCARTEYLGISLKNAKYLWWKLLYLQKLQ